MNFCIGRMSKSVKSRKSTSLQGKSLGFEQLHLNEISKEKLKLDKREVMKTKLKNLSKNSAFINHHRVKSSKIIGVVSSLKTKSEDEKLEQDFLNKLKGVDPSENFELYEQVFSDVIKAQKLFARVLEKIKNGYERRFGLYCLQNFNDLLDQVKELKEKCLDLHNLNTKIGREMEEVLAENNELSRTLEMTESLYLEVHEKLQKIYSCDTREMNEYSWKCILYENKKLKKENEKFKLKYDKIDCKAKYSKLNDRYHRVNTEGILKNESSSNESRRSGKGLELIRKDIGKPVQVPVLLINKIEKLKSKSISEY